MLGIIFGVGAVIAMISIGAGARQTALSNIKSLGLNNIIISNPSGANLGNNKILLNQNDLSTINNSVPTVKYSTGVVRNESEVKYNSITKSTEVWGTSPDYFRMMDLKIKQGGYFSNLDNKKCNKVCLLGNTIAKKLFKSENPLGKMVEVDNIWLRVVGILKYKPVRSVNNNEINFNNRIFIPLNSLQKRFNRKAKKPELTQIITQIDKSKNIIPSSNLIESILSNNHGETKNFELLVPEQLLQQKQQTLEIFNIVMGAIAGISLLVGGIGIMNIMLASVMERTNEIGIRRAVGANQSDIRKQFLTESVLISLMGGVLGIIIGFILSSIVSLYSGWNTIITFWSILLSVGISSLVGIIFGYFPAQKAARLNPINALRHE